MNPIVIALLIVLPVGLFLLARSLYDKVRHRERHAEVTITDMTRRDDCCYITYRLQNGGTLTCQVPEGEYLRRRVGQQGELVYIKDIFVEFLLPEQL